MQPSKRDIRTWDSPVRDHVQRGRRGSSSGDQGIRQKDHVNGW